MRPKILAGIALTLAPVLVLLIGAWLDLDLEPVALLGVAVGAVAALVPDRSPFIRLGGFVAGIAIAWIGYIVRAAVLPDTASGRAVALSLVVLACVAIAVIWKSAPLWALLLGIGAVAGAYETTFAAAPTEVLASSMSLITALLLTVAVGFLAAATFAPATDSLTQPADGPLDPFIDDNDLNDAPLTSHENTMEPIK